jgi:superfamily II DNA or RNA helicase
VARLVGGPCRGLWCATGLGKTFILLAAWGFIGVPYPALVVTRALGRHVWPRDARWVLGRDLEPGILWGGQEQSPGVHHRKSGQRRTYTSPARALKEHPAIVISYDILRARFDELMTIPWRALICDEVHEVKGGYKPPRDRNGKLRLSRYHFLRRLGDAVRARGGPVWTATATPITDRRRDLFAQLDLCFPGEFGSSYQFLTRYCGAYINSWGGLDTTGQSNTEELLAKIENKFVIVSKKDVADQLPPMQFDTRIVSYSGEDYRNMGGGVETALNRACAAKIPAMLELTREYLATRSKVIVVVTRRRLAREISNEIKKEKFQRSLPATVREALFHECVTGATEGRRRVALLEEFNAREGGPAVIVASIDSLSESVDLQQTDGAIVGGFPVVPKTLVQFCGRFSRLGGRPVTMHFLVAERTLDETYHQLIIEKLEDIEELGTSTDPAACANVMGGIDEDEVLAKLAEELKFLAEEGQP